MPINYTILLQKLLKFNQQFKPYGGFKKAGLKIQNPVTPKLKTKLEKHFNPKLHSPNTKV